MVKDTLIFDLDDTLISTHHHYSRAKINFVTKIGELIGFSTHQEAFDQARFKLYDFIHFKAGHRAPEIMSVVNVEHANSLDEPFHSFLKTAKFFGSKLGYGLNDVDPGYLYSIQIRARPSITEVDRIISARNLLNLNSDIDMGEVTKFGFQKERFPGSMVLTYEKICDELGFVAGEEVSSMLYKTGTHPFDEQAIRRAGLLAGVSETLDLLAFQGHEMHLLTKGDAEVQNMKVRANGFGRWFEPKNTHIVSAKKDTVLETIAANAKGNNIYKIGNSHGSDIRPALAAGIKAFYIPCETWAWEKRNDGEVLELPEDRVVVLEDISQLKERYS